MGDAQFPELHRQMGQVRQFSQAWAASVEDKMRAFKAALPQAFTVLHPQPEPEEQDMTLTEFLLARIAEDEERLVHDFDCERFNVRDYGSRQGDCDCDATARALAECEYKRRIVREATYWSIDHRPVSPNARQLAEDTLRLLALPHADHPGYREEWRP